MKLNLGCGKDYKDGYVNVDLRSPCDVEHNLLQTPWPWEDSSCNEILMLDFLEHLPYKKTDDVLYESWRVLKMGCPLIIQVPDFEHCANAAMDTHSFLCNVCGTSGKDYVIDNEGEKRCSKCNTNIYDISLAAIHRLFGGQDYEGNWHFNAFPKGLLEKRLSRLGFNHFEYLEKHHQWKNWNYKIRAIKIDELW